MRGPVKIIDRKNDLKNGYLIRLELGVIISLLIFISAFKMDINTSGSDEPVELAQQETIFIEEIVQTKQKQLAPPPPRPRTPIEVPNDEIIQDEVIELDSELDLEDSFMELPPPPPQHEAEEEQEEEEIFVIVEEMPVLIGGIAALNKHITYPDMARRAGIKGRVIVQFIIDKEGNVNNPEVIRGIGGGCDEVAIEAVKKIKFIPGKQRGRPVLIKYSMPINFTLKEAQN